MEKNDERFEKEKEFISMNIIMKCDESENRHDKFYSFWKVDLILLQIYFVQESQMEIQ